MREILFRGKRTDNGEWVYGNYAVTDNNEKQHFIFQNKAFECEVVPSTVGQYTGLSDMCGKKIFEGDIIKRFWFGKMCIYQINYDNGLASFIGRAGMKFTTFDYDSREFEIIGNIYDNPELLKERE